MLTQTKLSEITVPIPLLKVQNEIVEKLDQFAKFDKELRLELEKELEDRKQQYTYFLNTLFSFDTANKNDKKTENSVKWLTLGEVGKFIQGNGFK